jgi:hypothetical protein
MWIGTSRPMSLTATTANHTDQVPVHVGSPSEIFSTKNIGLVDTTGRADSRAVRMCIVQATGALCRRAVQVLAKG